MVKKSRGMRSGTRKKLRQKPSQRPSINKFLQIFEVGEDVVISPEPSSQKGMPFPRFIGRTGVVIGSRGRSYLIEIMDGKKKKMIISKPEHLKKTQLK